MASSGIVRTISGIVKAIANNGSERTLQVGDRVMPDELIMTGDSGAISIEAADGTRLDLGRSTIVSLNEALDNIDDRASSSQTQLEAQQEVAEIQQALVNDPDFDPTQLPAPAAGTPSTGATDAGDVGHVHTVVQIDYLNPTMTPENGFETTGITVQFPEFVESFVLNPVQPTSAQESDAITIDNIAVDESAGINPTATGFFSVNGTALQSVSLSATSATWDSSTNTLTAENNNNDDIYNVVVNTDGSYTFTLLNALGHPAGSGIDNKIDMDISAELTNDAGTIFNTAFTVSVFDDGPIVLNTGGSIKNPIYSESEFSEDSTVNNVETQTLEGLINYDLGLDGLGSVGLSLPGSTFDSDAEILQFLDSNGEPEYTSNGDEVVFKVFDSDGDNLDEVYGFVDKAPPGWDGIGGEDREVFTLEAMTNGQDHGAYRLVMHDVLDMPVVEMELKFNNVDQLNDSSVVVYSDAGSALLIEGNFTHAEDGFVGINDNEMNAGESTSYKFGTVDNNGNITQSSLVNDVQLQQVNSGLGADAVSWAAFKNGNPVPVDKGSFFYTAPDDGSIGISPMIHVDGGYDELSIVSYGGFQVAGLNYVDQSASDALSLDILFGFTATDNDGDAVSGEFTVAVGNSLSTALDSNLSTLLEHQDSVDVTA